MSGGEFCLSCAKEDFKFSSAHFTCHDAGREHLHGHNYRVFVSLQGRKLGSEGVVMDFSELKRVVRSLCKCVCARAPHACATHFSPCPPPLSPMPCCPFTPAPPTNLPACAPLRRPCRELDEKFLCPMASKSCIPTVLEKQVELRVVEDGSFFSLPRADVLCLPLANTTVEELSLYLAQRIVAGLGRARLGECGIPSVTCGVTETPGQECRYTVDVAEGGGAAAGGGSAGQQ